MTKPSPSQSSYSDEIDDAVLQELYSWVDQIPLSRPKKNVSRDFSDGVMIAETVAHYFPRMVELHNYAPATSTKLKLENWHVLNRKVFKKLQFELADDVINQVINCKPFVIERVLLMLRTKIDTILWEQQNSSSNPNDAEQNCKVPEVQEISKKVETPKAAANPKTKEKDSTPRTGPAKKVHHQNLKTTSTLKAVNGEGQVNSQVHTTPNETLLKNYLSNDTVPRMLLEEKIQECLTKEETIQILEAKVRRLEHLLHLKDIRINDLQIKLDGVRPTGLR